MTTKTNIQAGERTQWKFEPILEAGGKPVHCPHGMINNGHCPDCRYDALADLGPDVASGQLTAAQAVALVTEKPKHSESIRAESRIPKSALPVYLLFGDKLIGSFKTLEQALRHGHGNLVIESGLNVRPQPFHRAFTMAAYADQSPFWMETTVESATGRALAALIEPDMREVEPRMETGWKATYSEAAQ